MNFINQIPNWTNIRPSNIKSFVFIIGIIFCMFLFKKLEQYSISNLTFSIITVITIFILLFKKLNQNYLPVTCLTALMFIFISCTNRNIDNIDDSNNNLETVKNNKTYSYPIELKLDTNTLYQHKLITPDDSLFFGNKIHIGMISYSGIGYILFEDQDKFYVSLIESNNYSKVIGITEINKLNENEEYIHLLYSNKPITSMTFGIIKKINTKIKTVKAWKINNSKKIIEEIDPLTIDFTETYITDTY